MGIIVIIAIIVILVAVFLCAAYKKCPPDQAMIVTGLGRESFVIGNSAIIIPFFQRVDRLSLGVVQTVLETKTSIPTYDALLIDVKAVANFQISSDLDLLKIAAKNYLNQHKETIEQDVSEVMLGKMREVIGQMKIVDLMRNREEFNAKVFEGAKEDMHSLGLELTTFNVQDFYDHEDVIKNMGADQAAEVKKQAAFAKIQANQEVAVRQNELDLKQAELQKTADKAKAEAEMVFKTTTAEKQRELNIADQEARIAAEEKEIELKEREVAVKERELEATVKKQAEADKFAAEQKAEAQLYTEQKQAEAQLYTAQQEASAIKTKAQAEADKIEKIGRAEGQAEKDKGTGIAEATKKQIAAYNEMLNANFLADKYIKVMPEIARAVAEPLGAVDNITMYGEGNAAKLVEETTKMTSQVNNGLADSLGIDLKTILSGVIGGTAAGHAMKQTKADNTIEEAVESVTEPVTEVFEAVGNITDNVSDVADTIAEVVESTKNDDQDTVNHKKNKDTRKKNL